MSKKDTTFFNMKLSQTQKEIMDFISDVVYEGNLSKAAIVSALIKNKAYEYLEFPDELNLSDEMLLSALLSKKKEKDMEMIRFVGAENFEKMIEEFKSKESVNEDIERYEQLLKEYKEKGVVHWLDNISKEEVEVK